MFTKRRRYNRALKADKKKIIYLAGPYTHDNELIEKVRYLLLTHVSAKLEKLGVTNFSPITHSFHQSKLGGIDGKWKDWKKTDELFIERGVDEVWVLMLEGWEDSTGVQAEIEHAAKHNRTVRYFNLDIVDDKLIEHIAEEVGVDVYAK